MRKKPVGPAMEQPQWPTSVTSVTESEQHALRTYAQKALRPGQTGTFALYVNSAKQLRLFILPKQPDARSLLRAALQYHGDPRLSNLIGFGSVSTDAAGIPALTQSPIGQYGDYRIHNDCIVPTQHAAYLSATDFLGGILAPKAS